MVYILPTNGVSSCTEQPMVMKSRGGYSAVLRLPSIEYMGANSGMGTRQNSINLASILCQ